MLLPNILISIGVAMLSAFIAVFLGAGPFQLLLAYSLSGFISMLTISLLLHLLDNRKEKPSTVGLNRPNQNADLKQKNCTENTVCNQIDDCLINNQHGRIFSQSFSNSENCDLLPNVFCAGSNIYTAENNVSAILRDLGYFVNTCNCLDDVLAMISHQKLDQWTCLIVDAERLHDHSELSEVLNTLFEFRKYHVAIPVIVVSKEFIFDDFSAQNLSLYDARLSHPCTPNRMIRAINSARRNSLIWRNRKSEAPSRESFEKTKSQAVDPNANKK